MASSALSIACMLLLAALSGSVAVSQQAKPKTTPGRTALVESLDERAAGFEADRRTLIAAITTREQAEARQRAVRAKILNLLGPLPSRTPLKAQTLGITQRDGFRIEKVLFESQPYFRVTALLYLPEVPNGTRSPAILLAPGHSPAGKAGDYGLAGAFARNGFVVLSYDPIGQGERLQYPDPARPGSSLAARPTGEHGEASLQPTLLGQAVAQYFLWDAIRSIDFLTQRPEVDARRIGAFGCSGGGAMTALVGALDSRIATVAVACYNTTFDALLPSIGPQDGEQSIPGFIAAGLDFADWIELVAPRPYAAVATYSDMFPFAGARATVTESRRFYSLFDPASTGVVPAEPPPPNTLTAPALNVDTSNAVLPEARLQFITGPGGHGALAPILGDVLRFFVRNLRPDTDLASVLVPATPSFALPKDLPSGALQVTGTGQVATSFANTASIFTLNRQQAATLDRPAPNRQQLVSAVRAVTGAAASNETARHAATSEGARVTGQSVLLPSTSGGPLHGWLSVPTTQGRHPAVLLLLPDSLDADTPVAHASRARFEQLGAANNVVLALVPNPSFPGTDDMKAPVLGPFYLLSLRAQLVGRTLLGLRCDDVRSAIDFLAGRADVDPDALTAVGSGHMGLVLLHAGVLDSRLSHITVDHVLGSYRSLVDAPLPIGAPEDLLPGVLLHYDIPDLVRVLGPRLTLTEPLAGNEDLSQASTPLSTLR